MTYWSRDDDTVREVVCAAGEVHTRETGFEGGEHELPPDVPEAWTFATIEL